MSNKIRIISTSDIHGTVYPYSYGDGSSRNHGLARIATMIRQLRDDNSILIDNGDILEGSPLTFYHYVNACGKVNPLTECLKEMKYDFVNIGNHDFNYGTEELFRHLDNCGAQCITCNIIFLGKPVGNYQIVERCGKKIAIIGITTQFIPNWEAEEHIAGMEFPDAFDSLKLLLEEVKGKADYTVVVYHGGMERDPKTGELTEKETGENQGYRMLTELKGIDVMIAGHQHRVYCGTLNGTAYTEPFFNGEYLSVIEIDPETGEITPQLLKAEAQPDETIMRLASEEEQACQRWLDTPLGHCDMDLRILDEREARLHKSQLATFINKVQLELTGADISATAIFLRATGFAGDVTMRNIISTYIFPNFLVVKKMTGRDLREYLEFDAEFWSVSEGEIIINPLYDFPNPQHHNYDMLDGVEYTVKVSNPSGSKITSLTRNGQPVKDDDVFLVAMNNYRASGGGNYDMVARCETVKEIQESCVNILSQYVLDHDTIVFEPNDNITVEI